MQLDIDTAWLVSVLLCTLRLSALLLLAPFMQAIGLPARVRVLLVLSLAITLVSGMHLQTHAMPRDLPEMLVAGINELLIGSLMAVGIFVAFAAFSYAGSLLDLQIGFNIANVFDPVTRSQSPLIASLFGMLMVALFFSMDVHHTLLRGIAFSLERVPLGTAVELPSPQILARQFGSIFSLGLLLAAPPLFCLFLLELALAVLSRNLPQLNLFTMSAPIKISVGLLILAYTSAHFGSVAIKTFNSLFSFWDGVLISSVPANG